MFFFLALTAFAGVFLPVLAAQPAGETFAQFCLVVEESAAPGSSPIQTFAFEKNSTQGPGKRLAFYVMSKVDASVLVVAFNDKDRKLTNGWEPELVELKAWKE